MALVLQRQSLDSTGFLAQLHAAVHRMAGWPGRVMRHRRLMSAMSRMSDHDLRDIGLTGTDVADATAVPRGEDPSLLMESRRQARRFSARL